MERLRLLALLVAITLAVAGIGVSFTASPVAALAAASGCTWDPEQEDGGEDDYCNCADMEGPNKTCRQAEESQCVFNPPSECSTSCICMVME